MCRKNNFDNSQSKKLLFLTSHCYISGVGKITNLEHPVVIGFQQFVQTLDDSRVVNLGTTTELC